ncbi:hypothetical protein ACFPKZ_25605 [Streptosporangium amethystogenes subsp. fukuiense]
MEGERMGIREDFAELAEIHEEHDMGHTVAGWTGSIVCMTGFAISGLAMVAADVVRPLTTKIALRMAPYPPRRISDGMEKIIRIQ